MRPLLRRNSDARGRGASEWPRSFSHLRRRAAPWELLEQAARKPWAYKRPLLLHLAERCRAIEAVAVGAMVWEVAAG